MRKGDAAFIEAFINELSKCGGNVDAAILAAGRRMHWVTSYFGNLMNDEQIIKRANAVLARPAVSEAIREYYEVAAGFSAVEAAQWMVKHIRGEIEEENVYVTKGGDIIRYSKKKAPSESMLRAYQSSQLPKDTKKIQVDQRTLVVKHMVGEEPPGMKARALDPPMKRIKAAPREDNVD